MALIAAERAPAWLRGAVLGAALLLCAPLLFLAIEPGEVAPGLWAHLRSVMLPRATAQTLSLLAGVGLASLVLGIGLAWLVVRHEFPGRRWLEPALALPLAFPAYVLAYIYVAALAYDAPIASAWRAAGGAASLFPEIRSLGGTVFVLSLALYPYIYLLMRAALLRQGAAAFEAARTLGDRPLPAFRRVVLPATSAAWLAGLGLVLLETLADFGAVRLLGRDTLTTLVIQSWVGLGSLALAAQLALGMLGGVVLVLLLWMPVSHRRARPLAASARPPERRPLRGCFAAAATLAAGAIVALGVVGPLVLLLSWVPWADVFDTLPWSALRGTFVVAGLAALIAVAVGLAFSAARRRWPRDAALEAATAMAGLGYAVPGAVMAVAVFWALSAGERALGGWAAGLSTGLVALILALLMRFQRVGLSGAAAALASLRPTLVESAAMLGHGRLARWRHVAWPLLRPGLLAAFVLVFVEAMKELPATLMLRPFGWDTLAIEVYTRTAEGLWREAAAPALLLALVGALPVLMLLRDGRMHRG